MPELIEEKREIHSQFDRVAATYDLLTGMNPGYHEHLRMSASRLPVPSQGRILDLCCGTGASTQALHDAHPDATITALDASIGMLKKARKKPLARTVSFVHGDAMDADHSVDAKDGNPHQNLRPATLPAGHGPPNSRRES